MDISASKHRIVRGDLAELLATQDGRCHKKLRRGSLPASSLEQQLRYFKPKLK